MSIAYDAVQAGGGKLTIEVLNPEDNVLGHVQRHVDVSKGRGRWEDAIKLDKALPLEDLVWRRVRYHFEYDDAKAAPIEGVGSISQIIRLPVIS